MAKSSFMGEEVEVRETFDDVDICKDCEVNDDGYVACAAFGRTGDKTAGIPLWLIILLIVLVVTLLAIGLFVGIRNKKKKDVDVSNTAKTVSKCIIKLLRTM